MTATAPHDERIPRDLVAGLRSAAFWAWAMVDLIDLPTLLVEQSVKVAAHRDEVLDRSPTRCASLADRLLRAAAGSVLAVDEIMRAVDAPPRVIRARPTPSCPSRQQLSNLRDAAAAFSAAARVSAAAERTTSAAMHPAGQQSLLDEGGSNVDRLAPAFDGLARELSRFPFVWLPVGIHGPSEVAARLRGRDDVLEAATDAADDVLRGRGSAALHVALRRLRAAGFGYGAPRTT